MRRAGSLARSFVSFWIDFVLGEDWRLAGGVVLALAVGALLAAGEVLSDSALAVAVAAAILLVLIASVLAGVRRQG